MRTAGDKPVTIRAVSRSKQVAAHTARPQHRHAGLVLLGPVLALATFMVLGPFDLNSSAPGLRVILLADLVYVLVVAALVLGQLGRLIAARRANRRDPACTCG